MSRIRYTGLKDRLTSRVTLRPDLSSACRQRWEISRNFSRHFRPRTTWFLYTVRSHHGGKKAVGDLQKLLPALPAPHHVVPVPVHTMEERKRWEISRNFSRHFRPHTTWFLYTVHTMEERKRWEIFRNFSRHFRPRTTWFLYTVHTMEERKRCEISRNFSRHFRPRTTWFLHTVHTMEERKRCEISRNFSRHFRPRTT
jgi:hypothetical protein